MTTRAIHLVIPSLVAGLALFAGGLAGCRGERSERPPRQFFPDMDDAPKWKPQTETGFYTDKRAMRQPVAGTVAFGPTVSAEDPRREGYLREDVPFYTGKTGLEKDAKEVGWIPARVKITPELLKRGEERFNIYCSVCHNYNGDGKGALGSGDIGFKIQPANLMEDKFRDRAGANGADGHIFWVIMNGWPAEKPNMPSYAHALKAEDAWAIVAHIRAMQAATTGKIEEVPEADRPRLMQSKPAPTAPAAGAGEAKK